MTDVELFDTLESFFKDNNSVKIGNHYYNSEPFLASISLLRKRRMVIVTGLDNKFTPLELLMLNIMIDVAGINNILEDDGTEQ